MNNLEALELLNSSQGNIRTTTLKICEDFQVPEDEFETIRYRLNQLKVTRREFVKRTDIETWEQLLFVNPSNYSTSSKKLKAQSFS